MTNVELLNVITGALVVIAAEGMVICLLLGMILSDIGTMRK